jgi:hypothetical protein
MMSESGEEGFFGLIKKALKIEAAKDNGFSEKDALSQFQMVAAAGPTGQVAANEYGEGNTLVFSRFPPGTILRERTVNSDNSDDQFFWWCTGMIDKKTGKQGLFMAHGNQAYEEYLTGELKVEDKGLVPEARNKPVDFEVGPWGSIIDMWIHQNAHKFPEEAQRGMMAMKDTRRTVKVDLIKWGNPVKEEQKQNVPNGVVLQPVPEGLGARNK